MQKTPSPWQIIENLRAKKGVSKKALAETLRINYNYLVDLLNGRYQSKIDDEKLRILSSLLDIPIDKLLDELHGMPLRDYPSVLVPSGMPADNLADIPTQADKEISQPTSETLLQNTQAEPVSPAAPAWKIPVFRIISGSKIDAYFNQPELWQNQPLELVYLPSQITDRSNLQSLLDKDILSSVIAVKLEDHSLFPPCLAGSLFIIDTIKEPRLGDIVLVVLKNYRAWLIELNKIDAAPEGEKLTLRVYNSDYESIMVARKDILFIHPIIWIGLS